MTIISYLEPLINYSKRIFPARILYLNWDFFLDSSILKSCWKHSLTRILQLTRQLLATSSFFQLGLPPWLLFFGQPFKRNLLPRLLWLNKHSPARIFFFKSESCLDSSLRKSLKSNPSIASFSSTGVSIWKPLTESEFLSRNLYVRRNGIPGKLRNACPLFILVNSVITEHYWFLILILTPGLFLITSGIHLQRLSEGNLSC